MHWVLRRVGTLTVLLLVLAIVGLASGTTVGAGEPEWVVKTSGTPGLQITGNCTVTSGGHSTVYDMSGVVGREYRWTGSAVSCHVHKAQQDGELGLTISQNGQIVSESVTSGGTSDLVVEAGSETQVDPGIIEEGFETEVDPGIIEPE